MWGTTVSENFLTSSKFTPKALYTTHSLPSENYINSSFSHILFRLIVTLILWIATMHMWKCYPIAPPVLSGKSDYCLLLLNSCPTKLDGSEDLALLKSLLQKSYIKRSFRNGVGSGIKKTTLRRAKS
ncbi:neuropeptide S [Pogona vitticeps]